MAALEPPKFYYLIRGYGASANCEYLVYNYEVSNPTRQIWRRGDPILIVISIETGGMKRQKKDYEAKDYCAVEQTHEGGSPTFGKSTEPISNHFNSMPRRATRFIVAASSRLRAGVVLENRRRASEAREDEEPALPGNLPEEDVVRHREIPYNLVLALGQHLVHGVLEAFTNGVRDGLGLVVERPGQDVLVILGPRSEVIIGMRIYLAFRIMHCRHVADDGERPLAVERRQVVRVETRVLHPGFAYQVAGFTYGAVPDVLVPVEPRGPSLACASIRRQVVRECQLLVRVGHKEGIAGEHGLPRAIVVLALTLGSLALESVRHPANNLPDGLAQRWSRPRVLSISRGLEWWSVPSPLGRWKRVWPIHDYGMCDILVAWTWGQPVVVIGPLRHNSTATNRVSTLAV